MSDLLHLQTQVLPLDGDPGPALPRPGQRVDLRGGESLIIIIDHLLMFDYTDQVIISCLRSTAELWSSTLGDDEAAGSIPYLGDPRVAAAQVVSAVVHPVLVR